MNKCFLGQPRKERPTARVMSRNDRFVAFPVASHKYARADSIKDLGDTFLKDITLFFEHYNAMQERTSELLGVKGSREALKMIKDNLQADK